MIIKEDLTTPTWEWIHEKKNKVTLTLFVVLELEKITTKHNKQTMPAQSRKI